MSEKDWRPETDAETYFRGQKKTVAVADRRPVIRKAADIVGPGINAQATVITDFNNLLATYNGYFSAEAGAFGAPNDDEAFTGITVMDATMGGFQLFTGLGTGSGLGATWRRRFIRNPSDASSISWEPWVNETESGVVVGMISVWPTASPPAKHLILNGSTYSSATYPELFAVLGSTTLPDLRDRTVYGVGTAWGLLDSDGLAAGSRTKALKHEHMNVVWDDGAHSHGGGTNMATLPSNTTTGGGAVQRLGPDTQHFHIIGSDGSHHHLSYTQDSTDPYATPAVLRGLGFNWIIRAAP